MNFFLSTIALTALLFPELVSSFHYPLRTFTSSKQTSTVILFSSEDDGVGVSDVEASPAIPTSIIDQIENAKADLVQLCKSSSSSTKPSLGSVQAKVQALEALAKQGGIGQASSHSGLLPGEWYVRCVTYYVLCIHGEIFLFHMF